MSEILVATDSLRDAIIRKASAKEIEAIAIQSGMITMREDGLDKVRQGYTTLEEVLRVMHT
jgi:type IV pilus assembly protein PilB